MPKASGAMLIFIQLALPKMRKMLLQLAAGQIRLQVTCNFSAYQLWLLPLLPYPRNSTIKSYQEGSKNIKCFVRAERNLFPRMIIYQLLKAATYKCQLFESTLYALFLFPHGLQKENNLEKSIQTTEEQLTIDRLALM